MQELKNLKYYVNTEATEQIPKPPQRKIRIGSEFLILQVFTLAALVWAMIKGLNIKSSPPDFENVK